MWNPKGLVGVPRSVTTSGQDKTPWVVSRRLQPGNAWTVVTKMRPPLTLKDSNAGVRGVVLTAPPQIDAPSCAYFASHARGGANPQDTGLG